MEELTLLLVKLFDFWMQFFLFVGEDSSKAFCEYPVLVIEQVIRAQGNSPTPQRSYEFVPANLIIHRGPCDSAAENVQGPIESFDLLLIDSKSTNWQFPASDLAAVNTYMNDGRCLLMYVNRLDDFQVYFPSEAHRDRLYETLKAELFPDKNPIAPSNRQHQITNFTILKRPNGDRAYLGSGAFGKVFKAKDTDTGTVFALKEIEMGFKAPGVGGGGIHDGSGSGSMQLLRDEIQLHMRLKHQNIVKFLGHSIDSVEGKFYIFMEFVNGGSLSNFIQAHYRTGLPDSTAARFTNQILDGLIYLHEHEVIHRDIKGANVLVDLNNKDLPIMKIADFGTSKQLSKINNLFNTNMKGTPNFLAPEVIACPRGYTYTADVWSLGCTVIEMISGKIPFHGMDAIFIIFQIGRGTATPSVPENSSKHAADFIEKCCKANPSERMSPKDLKVHPWIVSNRDPDSSVCGSSSNVSRANGSGEVGGATLPKSSSRALLLQKEYDRSISVPNPDEAKVTVEDELKDLDAARASAKFQSDPAVENQPKSTNSPDRKMALRGRSSMPQGVLQGELRGGVGQPQRHRHKSGESQATEVTTPTKSAKRASTVHDGVRHALTYYIDKHQDKILDLWMRDTQRLHFQNKLNIDTDLLRLLLSAFNDYLKSQDRNEDLLNGGIDQVLDWIGEYDDSPVQVCEVFNSLKCFVETVTKLLKDGGDRADQVLQATFMLEPVVELAYYILSCKRPEALAMMDSTMAYDSGDEDEENNANTRESLDHIPETPSMPTFNDAAELGPRSLNVREQQPLSFDHFQTQQPRNVQGLNRQTRVNDSFNGGGAPRSFYFPPSFNPLDPRNVSSEPNSMASSGITGSLSGFSNYFQHMAQETGRLERQLAETQLTLNNLLSVQLTLNQARIADIVNNINTISNSSNSSNASRNQPQQQSVPSNATRPSGVNSFPPHPSQMTSRGDTHPNTNSLFSQYNINNMINNAIVNNCAPMYGFRPVYFPSQGFNRAPARPPPPMRYNNNTGGISTEESYEGTDGIDAEGNYVLVSELEPQYANRAERSQAPEANPPTVTKKRHKSGRRR
ncbi:uncharacterized protein LOC142356404 isoform X2 [Convolutriloba macropyga]|uniref:uncharacterized protein LOC142356404 isoform X2 n=1 Tax=Convolutriloba macropyga TaxID=536237 RepID=UPI003F51C7E1